MKLFIADKRTSFEDLYKSTTESKVPGVASGTSGSKSVACPLGAACPDGGHHQMGGVRLQEHSQQAMAQKQTGQKVGDESKGKPSGKPGVPPGASNIGGIGSDQVRRLPPPVKVDPDKTAEYSSEGFSELANYGHKEGITGVDQKAAPKQRSGEHVAGAQPVRPGNERTNVPNPLDPVNAPIDSKPMDHYRLARIAKESDDAELADKHVALAKQRAENFSRDEHRELASNLEKEGFSDYAKHHASAVQSSAAVQNPVSEKTKLRTSQKAEMERAAREKSNSELEEAKKIHQDTVEKLKKVKESNKQKLKQFDTAQAEFERKKAAGEKAVKPKKPKLEKEEEVPERPHLAEPTSDNEKLTHQTHSSAARELADNLDSHLNENPELPEDRKKILQQAHKMAVFHSNIGYTPTAEHKKELKEVQRAAGKYGKTPFGNQKAKDALEQQAGAEAQQNAVQEPRSPQTDLEHAQVADHKTQANTIKENISSHTQDPNLSPEEKEKLDRLSTVVDAHTNIEHLPESEQSSELKEVKKLAGPKGQKPYKPEAESEGSPQSSSSTSRGSGGRRALAMLNAGRGLGQGLAASATSPYGAAGHVGSQIINYGVTGSVTAGHYLLHDAETAEKRDEMAQKEFDKEKERQAKAEKQAAKATSDKAKVLGRGNT